MKITWILGNNKVKWGEIKVCEVVWQRWDGSGNESVLDNIRKLEEVKISKLNVGCTKSKSGSDSTSGSGLGNGKGYKSRSEIEQKWIRKWKEMWRWN